ncbi:MAG: hypothetical protein HZB66_01575 [Candidatus Aenigmarchaeota archaeon]|nr:hypothetical protein [Candidatus Aenigmarchaeota archaeon]
MGHTIYSPNKELMNAVVFFSGGASSLKAMLHDENYGRLYRVTGAYTDKEDAKGRQLCRDNGIPDLFISRKGFYLQKGLDPKDWDSRRKFYEMLAGEIEQFRPDVICLSGYMHIVSDPMLAQYQARMLNVHPADLTILSIPNVSRLDVSQLSPREVRKLFESDKPSKKIKGEHAVYDAIVAGEACTRSTIHIVTEDFDEGPIVVQSRPFPVDPVVHERVLHGQLDGVQEYASDLQDKMKTEGDGPAYLKALELISQGRLSIDGETLSLDGKDLPYCGFRLG